MATDVDVTQDVLQLRFRDDDGNLTELNAAHVAEVLQGLVGLASDFGKAGAFGDGIPGTLRVRPPREGSFVLEVVNAVLENPASVSAIVGVPPLAKIVEWSTRSMRAEVSGAEHLDNGNVLLTFQDHTVEEVPKEVWEELNKRKRKKKKQLREIMAPLSEKGVEVVELRAGEGEDEVSLQTAPVAVLDKQDYRMAAPEDEVSEDYDIFETEATMVTVDFGAGDEWRVKSKEGTRKARVEDRRFLADVEKGLALHKSDIFRLKIREDRTIKNGRTTIKWTILEVLSHRVAKSAE